MLLDVERISPPYKGDVGNGADPL